MVNNIVGIIGWPVAHSLSPLMHNQAFAACGLDSWRYLFMPVAHESKLREAVLGLRALGFRGANVTVPYKEAVIPFLDRLSPQAQTIGAVNTILVDEQGALCGHNTDAPGFINDLLEHGIDPKGSRVLLLGAGGSARALSCALVAYGCKHLVICNRTLAKALAIKTLLTTNFDHAVIDVSDTIKDALTIIKPDIIINATSLGLKDTDSQTPWDKTIPFEKYQQVYDIIYVPKKTVFLQQAEQDGAHIINGLGMLIHQGVLAFELWTGHAAPLSVMKNALSSFF